MGLIKWFWVPICVFSYFLFGSLLPSSMLSLCSWSVSYPLQPAEAFWLDSGKGQATAYSAFHSEDEGKESCVKDKCTEIVILLSLGLGYCQTFSLKKTLNTSLSDWLQPAFGNKVLCYALHLACSGLKKATLWNQLLSWVYPWSITVKDKRGKGKWMGRQAKGERRGIFPTSYFKGAFHFNSVSCNIVLCSWVVKQYCLSPLPKRKAKLLHYFSLWWLLLKFPVNYWEGWRRLLYTHKPSSGYQKWHQNDAKCLEEINLIIVNP